MKNVVKELSVRAGTNSKMVSLYCLNVRYNCNFCYVLLTVFYCNDLAEVSSLLACCFHE